jgi:hypothetical protein
MEDPIIRDAHAGKSSRSLSEIEAFVRADAQMSAVLSDHCRDGTRITKKLLLELIKEAQTDQTPQLPRAITRCTDVETVATKAVEMFKEDRGECCKLDNLSMTRKELVFLGKFVALCEAWGWTPDSEDSEDPEDSEDSEDPEAPEEKPTCRRRNTYHANASESLRAAMTPLMASIFFASDLSGDQPKEFVYRAFRVSKRIHQNHDLSDDDKALVQQFMLETLDEERMLGLVVELATRPMAECSLGLANTVLAARWLLLCLQQVQEPMRAFKERLAVFFERVGQAENYDAEVGLD